MPKKLNIVDAVIYKEQNPNLRVWYAPEEAIPSSEEYYEEDLVLFRGEAMFELNDNFKYPSWYDHDDSNSSFFYKRHIQGDINAETESEYLARLKEEEQIKKEADLKKKKKLKAEIKRKQKELEALETELNGGN